MHVRAKVAAGAERVLEAVAEVVDLEEPQEDSSGAEAVAET